MEKYITIIFCVSQFVRDESFFMAKPIIQVLGKEISVYLFFPGLTEY